MRTASYNDPGPLALLLAAMHLRDLAGLEFAYDPSSWDGLVLSQVSLHLQKLANGSSVRNTRIRRSTTAEFPRLFSYLKEAKKTTRKRVSAIAKER